MAFQGKRSKFDAREPTSDPALIEALEYFIPDIQKRNPISAWLVRLAVDNLLGCESDTKTLADRRA
jgi:hypothetical protein